MPPERPESSTTRLFVRRLAISSEFCVDGHRRRLDGTVSILRTYLVQGDHGDHCRQIITATPCQKEGKDESDNCTSRGQGSRGGQRVLLEAWAIGYMCEPPIVRGLRQAEICASFVDRLGRAFDHEVLLTGRGGLIGRCSCLLDTAYVQCLPEDPNAGSLLDFLVLDPAVGQDGAFASFFPNIRVIRPDSETANQYPSSNCPEQICGGLVYRSGVLQPAASPCLQCSCRSTLGARAVRIRY